MKRVIAAAACFLLLGAKASEEKLSERQRALHALNRLAFGPRPGDVDRILKSGVDAWIEAQMHPERIVDAAVEKRVAGLKTLHQSSGELVETYWKPILESRRANADGDREEKTKLPMDQRPQRVLGELMSQRILRAAESERQLNEVMVDFWFNHFNVLGTKGGVERFLVTAYERDVIRPNIWGRFEDLLMATAKSPAMLVYLDNARSRSGGLNENYAREIMELHTLGVDGGYTQKDVTELARVLTGWSVDREDATFVFRRFAHDNGAKTVIGVQLSDGGMDEGERMIRFLARHPSTARHIATKLVQRLVNDDPPKALVDRVAKTFLDSKGDLRKTVKAVISSPEFWDARNYRAKTKNPFEYAISLVRATDARIINPLPIARALRDAGEALYGAVPPTGYSDAADVWMNSGALMQRMNFALAFAANKVPGVDVVIRTTGEGDAVAVLSKALIGGDLSKATRDVIDARLQQSTVADEERQRLIVGLLLGSPEFQRQ
jgi:uncharacterized protein (DUF1800 family)